VPRLSPVVALCILLALVLACAPAPPVPSPTAPAATAVPPTTAPAAPTSAPTAAPTTAPSGQSVELLVFAAASLTDSFQAIGKGFEAANPGTKVTFNFGGSQQLAQQLSDGAPADVFASANGAQMQVVVKAGQIAADAPKTFARNRLVAILPANNPANVKSLADLARPGLKIILEDKAVPAGQYSLDFLDKASKDPTYGASYKADVLKNVVSYEQDVKAVVSKVSLGEGDAGIVYTTDVTPAVSGKLGRIDIPDQLNTIASYPIAPVKGSKHPDLAQKFVSTVLGSPGQTILKQWGFISPEGAIPSGAQAGAVALTGLVDKPATLAVADLQKLPVETVDVSFQGPGGVEKHTFRGVRLATVISQAGLKVDPKRKNDNLRKYVVVSAQDGYEAIISWGEIDPNLGNRPILLAWEQDGQPLSGQNGPVRLVAPGDAHGARYVSGAIRLEVRDVDSPPRGQ
jgi:molybdate transport system substrate-binding protein